MVGLCLFLMMVGGAEAAEPTPLGLRCAPLAGVRFCPGNSTTQRVPSFDGIPLDADVTLPATGDGPWPTIVLLNGLGGHKRQLEPDAPSPGNGRGPKIFPNTTHHSNTHFAARGYAVLAFSSRGFGESCGAGGAPAAQLQPAPCSRGFVRIADQRYEARDTQYLLGLLVDQGIARPDALGATGFSYGGGQAVQLGYLYDRVRCGAVVPAGDVCAGKGDALVGWRSPKGTPLSMRAIYGQWLWSDLIASLLPNGRFLDFDPASATRSTQPLGVFKQSYTNGLFGLAQLDGYVVAPQLPGSADAPWDLTTAVAQLSAGEPYGAAVAKIAQEFLAFHGGYGLTGRHASMLLESGWNDDVFPPSESLRAYQDLLTRDPRSDVALLLGDYGHGRAGNKTRVAVAFNDLATAFFDSRLRGVGTGPAAGSVTAYASTCPSGAAGPPDEGPFTAPSWAALHRRSLTIADARAQTVSSDGGNPITGYQFDPIPNTNPLGTADPCKTVPAEVPAGTATLQQAVKADVLMLGLPTIRGTVVSTGSGGQLAGRLWDVLPDGTQRLVTRGVYRLTDGQSGGVVFQLQGNGYRFAAGHTIKLELAPSDAPQFRASSSAFTAALTGLSVELPLATPCAATAKVTLPKVKRVRAVSISLNGRRLLRLSGRRARARTVTLNDLPVGRYRVRISVRTQPSRGKRSKVVVRRRAVRVCVDG